MVKIQLFFSVFKWSKWFHIKVEKLNDTWISIETIAVVQIKNLIHYSLHMFASCARCWATRSRTRRHSAQKWLNFTFILMLFFVLQLLRLTIRNKESGRERKSHMNYVIFILSNGFCCTRIYEWKKNSERIMTVLYVIVLC